MKTTLRTPAWRFGLSIATALLGAALLMSVATAAPGDGISASGVTVDKFGWWHSQNHATAGPTGNITVPPPPGVPAGTLAVGAVNGDADRIAAIGMLPDAQPGDTISSFTMTVKEAGAPAAGFNGEAAKIVACPITEFWVGVENGNGTWESRPTFDCSIASAEGSRGLDGTWSFDLLAIGQAWVDPNGDLVADGVALVEDVDAPEGFQTVLATEGDGAIVITMAYEPAGGTTTTVDTIPVDGGTDGGFDGGTDGFQSPGFGTGGVDIGDPTPTSAVTPGSTPQNAPPAAPRIITNRSPNILGNLPGGIALAIPLFLALLGSLAYSLGPAGEPTAATRQRGVSRALAARARAKSTLSPATPSETS